MNYYMDSHEQAAVNPAVDALTLGLLLCRRLSSSRCTPDLGRPEALVAVLRGTETVTIRTCFWPRARGIR